jgi:hypothetical protein
MGKNVLTGETDDFQIYQSYFLLEYSTIAPCLLLEQMLKKM